MELLETAKKRFSVRSYTDQKVEPEKLNKILEAAHVAPTAANLQPIHLIVAQSDEALAKISMAANIYKYLSGIMLMASLADILSFLFMMKKETSSRKCRLKIIKKMRSNDIFNRRESSFGIGVVFHASFLCL